MLLLMVLRKLDALIETVVEKKRGSKTRPCKPKFLHTFRTVDGVVRGSFTAEYGVHRGTPVQVVANMDPVATELVERNLFGVRYFRGNVISDRLPAGPGAARRMLYE